MKIYRIAQENFGLYYHGSKELEKTPTPRDFTGVYFSIDPISASKWGKYVAAYKINSRKFFKPNVTSMHINSSDFEILERFIERYGYIPNKSNNRWKDMGAAQDQIKGLTEENYLK